MKGLAWEGESAAHVIPSRRIPESFRIKRRKIASSTAQNRRYTRNFGVGSLEKRDIFWLVPKLNQDHAGIGSHTLGTEAVHIFLLYGSLLMIKMCTCNGCAHIKVGEHSPSPGFRCCTCSSNENKKKKRPDKRTEDVHIFFLYESLFRIKMCTCNGCAHVTVGEHFSSSASSASSTSSASSASNASSASSQRITAQSSPPVASRCPYGENATARITDVCATTGVPRQ